MKDTRPTCHEDNEFQTSTTTLSVYWNVLSVYDLYIRDAFVKVEERLVGSKLLPSITQLVVIISQTNKIRKKQ